MELVASDVPAPVVRQSRAGGGRRRSLQIEGGLKAVELPKNVCDRLVMSIKECMGAKPEFRDYSALKEEADRAFEKADDDHNGFLDAEELISLAGGSEDRVQRLIRVFDIDGNGTLNRKVRGLAYVMWRRGLPAADPRHSLSRHSLSRHSLSRHSLSRDLSLPALPLRLRSLRSFTCT